MSSSSSDITAMLFTLNVVYKSSRASLSSSNPLRLFASSSYVIKPFVKPFFTSSSFLYSKVLISFIITLLYHLELQFFLRVLIFHYNQCCFSSFVLDFLFLLLYCNRLWHSYNLQSHLWNTHLLSQER